MNRTMLGLMVAAGIAAPVWSQTAFVFKYPKYVAGNARYNQAPFGTEFALLAGVTGVPDSIYYKPRVVYGNSTGYFWVDSTQQGGTPNVWAVDSRSWATCPELKASSVNDTPRVWTVARCSTTTPGRKQGLRFRVNRGSNIDSQTPDSVTVLDLTAAGDGGWLAGHVYASSSGPTLEDHVVFAFRGDTIVGSCISEDNRILDSLPTTDAGSFFMAVKAGRIDSISVYGRTSYYAPSNHYTQIGPTWDVTPGDTTWVDGVSPGLSVSVTGFSPRYPLSSEFVVVSARIVNTTGGIKGDSIIFAARDTSTWTSLPRDSMHTDSIYFFHIPGLDTGATVYFHVLAHDSASGQRKVSSLASYRLPYDHSIYQIQYSTAPNGVSPDSGRYVHTSGIVTGIISSSKFFIGDAAGGAWHGIHVYGADSSLAIQCGDSIEVAGLVTEYHRQTQFDGPYRLDIVSRGRRFDTTRLGLNATRTEAFEGVLVRVDTVRVLDSTGVFHENRGYRIVNYSATDTGLLFVTRGCELIGTPIPAGYFSLVANGNQYDAAYELMPRVLSDLIPIPADVAVQAILAPTGTIPAGQVITPHAVVSNLSTIAATDSFYLRFKIGGVYLVDARLQLSPGATDTVNFAPWLPTVGTYAESVFSMLGIDPRRSNDTAATTLSVVAIDVGTARINAPLGQLDTMALITPSALFRNFGTLTTNLMTFCTIRDSLEQVVYADSNPVSLGGGDTVNVSFQVWPGPHPVGVYATRCSAYAALDLNPANDALGASFGIMMGVRDVGPTAIVTPPALIDTAVVVTPSARVRNYGDAPATFRVYCRIDSGSGPVFRDSLVVMGLSALKDSLVVFSLWPKPHPAGNYVVVCSTGLEGDINPTNDVVLRSFAVREQLVPTETGWVRKSDIPLGPKSKKVTDGASLSYLEEQGLGAVYCLKGNNTCEFYRYNTLDNAWTTRESIPAYGSARKKKAVKKGSSSTTAGEFIYATKGNNTLEFWRYDPSLSGSGNYPWQQLADVPAGAKALKEGSGLAGVKIDTSWFVYLLKGSGTTEFYRYDVATGAWQTLNPAPTGASGKPFKNGSSLSHDPDLGVIYCLKGSTNEFFAHFVDGGSWLTLTSLPLTGSAGRKKVKDGSGTAVYQHQVYALKGGNTNELWVYVPDSARWFERTSMPLGSKRVKGGGALVAAPSMKGLYALRGNKTTEFWFFGPGTADDFFSDHKPEPGALTSSTAPTANCRLGAIPNPCLHRAGIAFSLPRTGAVRLRLFDIAGAPIRTLVAGHLAPGSHFLQCALDKLPRGVYLVRLETEEETLTRKLILE